MIARVRRAIFARHAHPWSAWSRWATTPLVPAAAVVTQMALTLVYWRQMVRYLESHR